LIGSDIYLDRKNLKAPLFFNLGRSTFSNQKPPKTIGSFLIYSEAPFRQSKGPASRGSFPDAITVCKIGSL